MDHQDNHPSDEVLVSFCQKGDFSSFEIIYKRYQRPILAYIFQLTRDYEASACIAQDVFLKVFERVDRFDTNRRFSTWFYTIARNASLDWIDHRKRTGAVRLSIQDDENAPEMEPTAPAEAIDAFLARQESTVLLAKALAELPSVHREVIELVVFQSRSYEEAAEIIGGGTSLGTLRSRMFHALKRLRAVADLG